MENKIFELMEKMYSDLSGKIDGIGSELQEVKTEVKSVNKKLGNLEAQVTKIEVEHGNKLDSLFDGYKQNSEKLNTMEEKIDALQMDVNNLSMKTTHNDTRIIQLSQELKKAK